MKMNSSSSNLATSFIAVFGGMFAAWYAKKTGTELSEMQSAGVAMLIGAASNWVFAVIDSFVSAVTSVFNALAARSGQLVDKLGGLKSSTPPAILALPAFVVLAFALGGCGMFGDVKPVIVNAPASCK